MTHTSISLGLCRQVETCDITDLFCWIHSLSAVEGSCKVLEETACCCNSNCWPVEVNEGHWSLYGLSASLSICSGHPGFWLCLKSPRAAQAETLWEETQSCSGSHPGIRLIKTAPRKIYQTEIISVLCPWQKAKASFLFLCLGCLEVLCYQPLPYWSGVHLGFLRADGSCPDVQVSDKTFWIMLYIIQHFQEIQLFCCITFCCLH